MDSNWKNEILKCKKINNNKVINNKFDINTTIKIFENLKNKKNFKENYDFSKEATINSNNIENKSIKEKNNFIGIDANTDKRLRTGKYKFDRIIDLHGYTLEEAFDCLINTVDYCYNSNIRCILVITGKSIKNTENGKETIKSSIKNWLNHPNIVGKILKYTEATKKDGGCGALYILLKKNKLF